MTKQARLFMTSKLVSMPLYAAGLMALAVALTPPTSAQADRAAVSAHVLKGNQLAARRQFEAALAEYEAAAAADPGEQVVKNNIIELHNNWGTFLFSQQKYEEAIAEFEKCIELNPRHNFAKRNLALVQQQMQHEGIPVPPPGTKGGREPQQTAAEKEKAEQAKKKEEPAAKVTGSSSVAAPPPDPSQAKTLFGSFGQPSGFYVSGSSMYPTYSKAPSAGSSATTTNFDSKFADKSGGSAAVASPATQPQIANPPVSSVVAPTSTPVAPSVTTPSVMPVATVSATPAASSGCSGGASIDDHIADLEKNTFGQCYPDLSYLKRLEQLEMKLFRQLKTGSLDERVEFLRKKVGI